VRITTTVAIATAGLALLALTGCGEPTDPVADYETCIADVTDPTLDTAMTDEDARSVCLYILIGN
jgi:hypothetical protein